MHDDILSVGLRVIGISPQDAASHTRFKEKYDLPFTLLSDPDKVAIKMYDVNGPLGIGVKRVTYLITQGAKIHDAIQADLKIGRHKEFIEKAVILREAAGMKSSGGKQSGEEPVE
jgi:peroxiredoxin Q/BCP